MGLTDEEKDLLLTNIKRRLTPQAVKIRAGYLSMQSLPMYMRMYTRTLHTTERHLIHECSVLVLTKELFLLLDIEVSCYGYEGVDAVKESLKEGLRQSQDSLPVRVSTFTWSYVICSQ